MVGASLHLAAVRRAEMDAAREILGVRQDWLGFVDSGFSGNLTLELSNVANLPITIYHGMPIGQISFMRMDGPVEHPYGDDENASKYQGQAEPTPSRFYLNFERDES